MCSSDLDSGYKFDRGGMPAEMGPYIGIVVNNVDNTRAGRLQVWIAEFGATNADGTPNLKDDTLWRTVSYCPPFYGATPVSGTSAGVGTYPGNQNSYGMWFTPPDVGITVLCVFVNGDRSQGFYIGVVPAQSVGHMVPAIGATSAYVAENKNQAEYFAGATRLPVVELNTNNAAIEESGTFFDKPKPIQAVVAETMFRQGLIKDPERGPISSSSQRETPSQVYGVSTPGVPIYQGGMKPGEVAQKINEGTLKPQDLKVIGRDRKSTRLNSSH